MTPPPPPALYRFGLFEADTRTAELRRQGVRIKLNAQPFQVLSMLLERPGQLLTRDDIARELWPNETFVDFEHGVNSAINRIREALGDTAASPRFVETLARRGYRFIAPVERLAPIVPIVPIVPIDRIAPTDAAYPTETPEAPPSTPTTGTREPTAPTRTYLASPAELPNTSRSVVQTLFVLLQIMYVGFYIGALANLPEIADLLSPLPYASKVFIAVIATAAVLIPVRTFVISAALFHAPGFREKLLRIWPFLLVADILWSLSPFLLLHHINFGLALACTPLLVYSPFAQRALILMGAGVPQTAAS